MGTTVLTVVAGLLLTTSCTSAPDAPVAAASRSLRSTAGPSAGHHGAGSTHSVRMPVAASGTSREVRAGSYPVRGPVSIGGGVTVRFLTRQPDGTRLKVVTGQAPALPAGQVPLAPPARLELVGGTFGRGAVLTYPLPKQLANAPARAAHVSTREEGASSWHTLPAIVDAAAGTITVRVPHFSWYAPWTWDWVSVGAHVNQGVGRLLGKRAPAASCTSGTASPAWVRSTPGVANTAALEVRGCTEGKKNG